MDSDEQIDLLLKSLTSSVSELFTETALETSQTVSTILESVDDTKTRLTTTEKQVDALANNTDNLINQDIPDLVQVSKDLENIFPLIDQIEQFVNDMVKSVQLMKDRYEEVHKSYRDRHPNTIKKLFSKVMGNSTSAKSLPPMIKWTHPDFIINPSDFLTTYYHNCDEMQELHKVLPSSEK